MARVYPRMLVWRENPADPDRPLLGNPHVQGIAARIAPGSRLRSVSAVFAALADWVEDAGSKAALASLLKAIWGSEYEDERDARFINDRVHATIQKDITFSVIPHIYGGATGASRTWLRTTTRRW